MESARDSTVVVRVSVVETTRVVECRRRIVTVLILGEFGVDTEEIHSREKYSCNCGGDEQRLWHGKRGRRTEK